MSCARPFPFVLEALEWNQAEIYSVLKMQLSHARHFAPSGNPALLSGARYYRNYTAGCIRLMVTTFYKNDPWKLDKYAKTLSY